jgi:transcriptional regulator with XRE-family HTH domain
MDVSQTLFSAHNPVRIKPRRIVHVSTVDRRTQAFRVWIEALMQRSGLNQTQLAAKAGLSHSTLSRAMTSNDYKVNFRQDTIERLAAAGGIAPPPAIAPHTHPAGFSEPEAQAWTGAPERDLSPNQTIWTVRSPVLMPIGLMPGDRFILDQAATARTGDAILVQLVDHRTGTAETLLRLYADGFAVTPLYLSDGTKRLWIDNNAVAVAGVIIESWRTRAH